MKQATGENILDKASPARDETVGHMIQMLADFEMFGEVQAVKQDSLPLDGEGM